MGPTAPPGWQVLDARDQWISGRHNLGEPPSPGGLEGSTRLRIVAFGQQSGPPASASQVRELLSLLNQAGHASFREARGPMGFTQRQGAGKFTRDEATGLIDRLQDAESGGRATGVVSEPRPSATQQLMGRMPDEELATELRRRGWTVTHP
jgi:hypothetical protein